MECPEHNNMAFTEYDDLESASSSSKEMEPYVDPEPQRPLVQLVRMAVKWIHEAVELAGSGHNPLSKS